MLMEIGQGVAEKSRAQKLKKIIIRKKKTLMTQDNLDMWFMKSKKKNVHLNTFHRKRYAKFVTTYTKEKYDCDRI